MTLKEAAADVRTVTAPWTKPLPSIDFDNEEFWDGLKRHEVLLWRCKKCREWYWPKAYCRNHENEAYMANLEWTPSSGRGKVFAFNVHHIAFHPGFAADIPYVYAVIELDEGPLISTMLIDVDPTAVKVGLPVQVVYEDHPNEGFTIPRFKPVSGGMAKPG